MNVKPAVSMRDLAYVLRCSGAATVAYALASALGLVHPVWASISGVIVSQEKLDQTRSAVFTRFAGTITGIIVAVIAGSLLALLGQETAVQTGVSVAICAALARRWPDLKVAVWTAPIVFLSDDPDVPLLMAGYWRGSEVVLGGLVGGLLHWITERAMAALEQKPEQ